MLPFGKIVEDSTLFKLVSSVHFICTSRSVADAQSHSFWLDSMPRGGYLVTDFEGEEKLKVYHVEKYFGLSKQCCFEEQE